MDILDAIINFLNITDSANLVKKNWNTLADENEYLGERIKSFLAFIFLIITYLFLIIFSLYIIHYLIFK